MELRESPRDRLGSRAIVKESDVQLPVIGWLSGKSVETGAGRREIRFVYPLPLDESVPVFDAALVACEEKTTFALGGASGIEFGAVRDPVSDNTSVPSRGRRVAGIRLADMRSQRTDIVVREFEIVSFQSFFFVRHVFSWVQGDRCTCQKKSSASGNGVVKRV